MKTVETVVYTYRELKELVAAGRAGQKALERAEEWLREGLTDGEWYEYVLQEWKEALDQIGFLNADIRFSGFWNAGDGASFTAEVDAERLIDFMRRKIRPGGIKGLKETIYGHDEDFRPWVVKQLGGYDGDARFRRLIGVINDIGAEVRRTGNFYSHANTCYFDADYYGDKHHKLFREWRNAAENLRRRLSEAIYRSLEEEYNHLSSPEAADDVSEANGYTFTVDGTRFG